jgi:hypothetical protein
VEKKYFSRRRKQCYRRSRRGKAKKKIPTIKLELSEERKIKIKHLMDWERRSAETNQFWILEKRIA